MFRMMSFFLIKHVSIRRLGGEKGETIAHKKGNTVTRGSISG